MTVPHLVFLHSKKKLPDTETLFVRRRERERRRRNGEREREREREREKGGRGGRREGVGGRRYDEEMVVRESGRRMGWEKRGREGEVRGEREKRRELDGYDLS